MKKTKSPYHVHRFPAGVINCAGRWYLRFQLSLRDIEEPLFERGVIVTYETIGRWCEKFDKGFTHRVKAVRRKPGNTLASRRDVRHAAWRTTFAVARGRRAWRRTWHPAAKAAQTVAAKRSFRRVPRSSPSPDEIVPISCAAILW
jgi:putative transposase